MIDEAPLTTGAVGPGFGNIIKLTVIVSVCAIVQRFMLLNKSIVTNLWTLY
jgi:hypothetical protein